MRFSILARIGGQMHAETLHDFLETEKPYDEWLRDMKKDPSMKYGKNFFRFTVEGVAKPKLQKKDTGEGVVSL